nr:hypothetical protein [Candidatus Brocadiia bacterium]
TVGAPSFKTDRLLGGRSLAADAFLRTPKDCGVNAWPMKPGFGMYHHKDGYNVLFGDGHTAWYGDPQQRIMYFLEAPATNGSPTVFSSGYEPLLRSYSASYGVSASIRVIANDFTKDPVKSANGRQNIYHLFDSLAGYDEGVTPLP